MTPFTSSSRRVLSGLAVLVFCLAFMSYWPALSAGFVFDDGDFVTGNSAVRNPSGLHEIWTGKGLIQYYPLLFTFFWTEYRLWGGDPAGYHVVNVMLHACNALLLGAVLRRLEIRGANWVALLFVVHPVYVESVAWIAEAKNLLSGFFYLASLLAFASFVGEKRLSSRHWTYSTYWIALVLFACAMLSKTASVTLPAVLALLLVWRNGRLVRADLPLLAPFFLVAAAVVPVTVFMEEELIDLVREDFEFSWGQRIALAARALLFYPQKLLIPYPLIFNYPRWNLEAGTLSVFWPVAVAALLALVSVVLWRRGWRGSVCALVFYVIVVSPALGFFNVYAFRYSFVADHWQYLASIGPLILIVQAGSLFGQRFAAEAPVARGLAGAVVVLLLGALTWNQAHAYRDSPTLWRDTIAKNPDSWIAHHEMGLYYTRESRFTEALHSFDEALRAKPHAAESYTGRGSVYAMRGEIDRAFEDLDRAIQLTPRYPHSHLIRGNLRLELEQFRGAIEDFDVVLAAKPDHFRVRLSRGTAKQGLGDDAGACEDWLRACVMNADRHEIDCRLLECLRDDSGR